jgi:3-hydroxyisobutyrate dehydrogenase-like beta-hydroxyacid dehydrogenase
MALNILKRGFAVRGCDLIPAAVDALAAAGGTPAPSPADAARGADVVITMLPNSSHVEEAVFGPAGIAEGIASAALYIDMSTIAPAMTDALAARLAERGIHMVDAPVGRQQQHAPDHGRRGERPRARPADPRLHGGHDRSLR